MTMTAANFDFPDDEPLGGWWDWYEPFDDEEQIKSPDALTSEPLTTN